MGPSFYIFPYTPNTRIFARIDLIMESKEILYKPKDLYEKQLKGQYHQAAEQYFEKLVKETNTDVEANNKHVAEYKALEAKEQEQEKILSSSKGLKFFLIFLIVVFFIAAFVCIGYAVYRIDSMWWLILVAFIPLGLAIFLIVHISKKVNGEISEKEEALAKIRADKDAKLKECWGDMSALNSAFDWSLPATIMEKVTGIIDLDPYFSAEKLYYLHDKFGFASGEADNQSVLGIISGNIQGNPFILKKTLEENLRKKTYTGSLTIYWTTTSTDSDGHVHVNHHSQTLHASVQHDAPFYDRGTMLVYGNEAAPHLTFTREPSCINSLRDEKDRERYVKKQMKAIRKKADAAIENGSTFTQMDNDEFEVFFGGTDRNNEVEFRLLFTPLAQTNMMALLSDPQPYGDDFHMIKDGMCNYIISEHSQSFDYSSNPSIYMSYDVGASKDIFISYSDEYIKHLFFDLAPILSIPLYQMHKPQEYIYEKGIYSNYSFYEHESIANSMKQALFMPDGCDPSLPVMIRSRSAVKRGKVDHVNVHTYSYMTTEMIDYVPVHGGDGYWHDVPVHWIKYDRIDDDKSFDLTYTGLAKKNFTDKVNASNEFADLINSSASTFFGRGMMSMVFSSEDREDLDDILKRVFDDKNDAGN